MEVELEKTYSTCPKCYKVIPAVVYEKDGQVRIKKTCSEHGDFDDVYWSDANMYHRAEQYKVDDWQGVMNPNVDYSGENCPHECGLCKRHKTHTNLANIVVTNRCNLSCWYCFFYAKKGNPVYEPSLEKIREMFRVLRAQKPVPSTAIQITGGEPTMRDDLIDIIKMAREEGFTHVQLNTNGIKLAFDPDLAVKVREAGVNTVYMSFDGVSPKTNPKNHYEIPLTLNNLRKAGLGTVLVPTVIKGVNDHEIGDIFQFAVDNMDIVRGVVYQPVSLVGQMPASEREKQRITIPEVIHNMVDQTPEDWEISPDDFFPIPTSYAVTNFVEAFTKQEHYRMTSHFACGMATYLFKDGDRVVALPEFFDVEGFVEYLNERAEEMRSGSNKYLTGAKLLLKLNSFIDKEKAPKGLSLGKLLFNALVKHDYKALGEFHYKTLFIGMMHFMDPYNYDVHRVERCVIHYIQPDGKVVPFCAFNVLPHEYRDKVQEQYSIPAEEYEKKVGHKLEDEKYKRNINMEEHLKVCKWCREHQN